MLKFIYDLPKEYQGSVTVLFTCCWDLSAVIFYIFSLIYFKLHLSITIIFIIYASILTIPLLFFSYENKNTSPDRDKVYKNNNNDNNNNNINENNNDNIQIELDNINDNNNENIQIELD